jgi:transposase
MKLEMSKQELRRHFVIKQSLEGLLTVAEAAERLSLSQRRIKQLRKEYRKHGAVAVIHGNANKPSPKKLDPKISEQILLLRDDEILGKSNFTHFTEIINERYGIEVSYSTVYRLLTGAGHKSPKKRRNKRKIHPARPRKPALGVMLQADATPYAWFGGKEKYALHGFIDDATNTVTGLYICKNECLLGYNEVLRQTLINHGIPQSLYPDRYSVFFVNPKKEQELTIEEQLEGIEKKLTQFGKIVERLGIDMFPANSPQAKGRIERLWATLQSRLPVEFALRGITSMQEANKFLADYIPVFNEQFTVEPEEAFSAFVPLPHTEDLDRLLCASLSRKLSAGSTISIRSKKFKIEQNKFPAKTEVTVLLSEKHGLRALINGAFYTIYPIDKVTQKRQGPIRTGDFPHVVTELIHEYLLKNAKAA